MALLATVGYLAVQQHQSAGQIAAIQAALQAGAHAHADSRQLAFVSAGEAPPVASVASDYPAVLLLQQPASPQGEAALRAVCR